MFINMNVIYMYYTIKITNNSFLAYRNSHAHVYKYIYMYVYIYMSMTISAGRIDCNIIIIFPHIHSIAIQIHIGISLIRFNVYAKTIIPSLVSDGITVLAYV
jgi:hypothetical protein